MEAREKAADSPVYYPGYHYVMLHCSRFTILRRQSVLPIQLAYHPHKHPYNYEPGKDVDGCG